MSKKWGKKYENAIFVRYEVTKALKLHQMVYKHEI